MLDVTLSSLLRVLSWFVLSSGFHAKALLLVELSACCSYTFTCTTHVMYECEYLWHVLGILVYSRTMFGA